MRRGSWAVPLTVGLSLLPLSAALAHADYLRSRPGAGANVAEAPERVDIWFTQELFRRAGENWIEVVGPDGVPVQEGEAEIDDDDRAHMWVDLQAPFSPGDYRVTWRTLSAADGDTEEGEFTFRFDPQVAVTSTPMGEEFASSPPSSAPPTASQATLPPPPPPEAPPLVPPEGPLPTPTVIPPEGGGCALGLMPLIGLMGLRCLPRKARR